MAALILVCALGAAATNAKMVKRASDDPCKKCNIADTNRECGRCHSSKLWSESSEHKGGYLYTNYKCDNCGHRCMHKEKTH